MSPNTQVRFTDCHVETGVLIVDIVESELHGDEPMQGFGRELLAAVDKFGVHDVALNFARVTYLTSAAFDPLTSLLHRVRERSGRLILCGLSPLITEVFEVTELIGAGSGPDTFETRPDVAAAVAALAKPTSV